MATSSASLGSNHLSDLKQAALKLSGAKRRAFQADMTAKYCEGNARQAEDLFGWSRHCIRQGQHEQRTGLICFDYRTNFSGNKRWEDKHPQIAQVLWSLAESHSQQDPSFRSTLAFTRLTAAEALRQLREHGFAEDDLPAPSTMAEVLNRNHYRLRPVLKAKPQKNS